jgi:hypothetical protein
MIVWGPELGWFLYFRNDYFSGGLFSTKKYFNNMLFS